MKPLPHWFSVKVARDLLVFLHILTKRSVLVFLHILTEKSVLLFLVEIQLYIIVELRVRSLLRGNTIQRFARTASSKNAI